LRSSTGQIGLARVKEGTDLIRIGQPLRPEFAGWRYGKHFQRRLRIQQAAVVTSLAASVALRVFTGAWFGFGSLGAPLLVRFITRKSDLGRARRFIVQQAEREFGTKVWKYERVGIRIIPAEDPQGWGLRFALDAMFLDFHGADALHAAHIISPAINASGASIRHFELAVREIEIANSPEAYFRKVLKYGQSQGWRYTGLSEYPEHMRLAFEMASHEQSEQVALAGDLAQLEQDWREAEEIASIADNLLLPQAVTDFIARHRGTRTNSALG